MSVFREDVFGTEPGPASVEQELLAEMHQLAQHGGELEHRWQQNYEELRTLVLGQAEQVRAGLAVLDDSRELGGDAEAAVLAELANLKELGSATANNLAALRDQALRGDDALTAQLVRLRADTTRLAAAGRKAVERELLRAGAQAHRAAEATRLTIVEMQEVLLIQVSEELAALRALQLSDRRRQQRVNRELLTCLRSAVDGPSAPPVRQLPSRSGTDIPDAATASWKPAQRTAGAARQRPAGALGRVRRSPPEDGSRPDPGR